MDTQFKVIYGKEGGPCGEHYVIVCENTGNVDLEGILNAKWNYLQDNMLYNVFSGL